MDARIGIGQEQRAVVALELSKILSDEFILYTKSRKAHWNVEGPEFYSYHKFFEAQYEFVDEVIDDVAERIRSLGHCTPATFKEFLRLTRLTEQSSELNNGVGFIKELLFDHEAIIVQLRKSINVFLNDYGDAGTSDFITGLMERHEKMAWMLRAHLR